MRGITILVLAIVAIVFVSTSCARGISPYEAANGKNKCGRYIK